MALNKESAGRMPDGTVVDRYTFSNRNGLRVAMLTYGATVTSVEVPDRNGKIENVVLSLESLDDYLKGHPYLGSTVGRYANRIAKGRFTLQGKEYVLGTNNGANHLHGGIVGFDKVVWKAEPVETADSVGVVFTHVSPDGDEGYPGKLDVKAAYTITDSNQLNIAYTAITDAPTIVNLTNHAYWNLTAARRDVLGHELALNADRYLPVDGGLIPTGQVQAVAGTPMDFTRPETIGARIAQVEGGYDHCYVLNREDGATGPTLTARVVEPESGRVMEVFATQPGVQLYSGNFLDGSLRRGNTVFAKHFGFCLETQHFPDSPNRPAFPSVSLMPGQTYSHTTLHNFGVQ